MLNRTWLEHLTARTWCLVLCTVCAYGQSQNAIGAYRAFERTSFSCTDRPSGYYADIETGCQIYHMCDGLGRQFSYSCPNTTLFQQRMLVCDHWYMVNCSKAVNDYSANLLIGQRDKPFVNDEENSLRTPRPDLLDRPYASDYSGESFRKQYKEINALRRNHITDTDDQNDHVQPSFNNHIIPGQQHWKIQFAAGKSASALMTTTTAPSTPSTRKRSRQHKYQPESEEDLSTSHSTRYNMSSDFSRGAKPHIAARNFPNHNVLPSAETTKSSAKTPSRTSKQQQMRQSAESSLARPGQRSIALPPLTTYAPKTASSKSTTARSLLSTPIFSGRPFSPASSSPDIRTLKTPKTANKGGTDGGASISNGQLSKATAPPFTRGSKAKVLVPLHNPKGFVSPQQQRNTPPPHVKTTPPSNVLLPPIAKFADFNLAPSKEPPIYYEVQTLASDLEPPATEPPFAKGTTDFHVVSTLKDTAFLSSGHGDDEHKHAAASNNNFLTSSTFFTGRPHKTPFEPTTALSEVKPINNVAAFVPPTMSSTAASISELRKQFSVPEYLFPLDTSGRTGYFGSNIYNSFQIKIPEPDSSPHSGEMHWFGENPKCPQCHPAFTKPGTCEPCIRR